MNKKDYILKVDHMINEGVQKGKYEWANEKTHEGLEKFQHFLYRDFKDHPKYSDMRPVSNQPARIFVTAKNLNHFLINLDDLKFRPVTDQSNTYTYNPSKIVSDSLQPLAHNDYVIKDTLTITEIIKNDVLDPDEEYVWYDVERLFTSIPVNETIWLNHHRDTWHKIIEPMCKSKLIFRCLLEKLTQNCVFR